MSTQVSSAQQQPWPSPQAGGPGARGETIYVTALATLMLEVYYRFLPGTGAGK